MELTEKYCQKRFKFRRLLMNRDYCGTYLLHRGGATRTSESINLNTLKNICVLIVYIYYWETVHESQIFNFFPSILQYSEIPNLQFSWAVSFKVKNYDDDDILMMINDILIELQYVFMRFKKWPMAHRFSWDFGVMLLISKFMFWWIHLAFSSS